MGAANTAILITSGFFMALAVWAAEMRKKKLLVMLLVLTTVFGLAFLGVKYFEYKEKYELHHIPGASFDVSRVHQSGGLSTSTSEKPLAPDMAQKTQIFFFLYFAMTGMHALHMIIGIGMLFWLMWRAQRGEFSAGYVAPIENFGLVLALRRYCVAVPVPIAVPDQPSPAELEHCEGNRDGPRHHDPARAALSRSRERHQSGARGASHRLAAAVRVGLHLAAGRHGAHGMAPRMSTWASSTPSSRSALPAPRRSS